MERTEQQRYNIPHGMAQKYRHSVQLLLLSFAHFRRQPVPNLHYLLAVRQGDILNMLDGLCVEGGGGCFCVCA